MSGAPASKTARYVPLVKVGSGAYATVYVALDRGPLGVRQLVAQKVLHPHLADEPAQREALAREARLLASVRHPNVVELRDVVVDEGVRLVLGYVEGVTLGRWLVELAARGARIPPAVVVRVARDAAAGLDAIHEAKSDVGKPLGLVHRDVSPQNLLVGVDGVTRLSDFGTAKILFEPTSETTEGSLKGKLGYMAPEYIRGAPVDRRVDVFALGVVVWEAFTGKRLFRGGNEGETLDKILTGDIPAPSAIDASLAPFDHVLARALARDPEQRTPTALAFGRAIEDAARRAGLEADHADVGAAMCGALDQELAERRALVTEAIAASDASAATDGARVDSPTSAVVSPAPSAELATTTSSEVRAVEAERPRRPARATYYAIVGALVLVVSGLLLARGLRSDDAASPTMSPSATERPGGGAPATVSKVVAPRATSSALVSTDALVTADASAGSMEPTVAPGASASATTRGGAKAPLSPSTVAGPHRTKPPPNPY